MLSHSSAPMSGQSSSVTRECDCLACRSGNAVANSMCERRYPTEKTTRNGPGSYRCCRCRGGYAAGAAGQRCISARPCSMRSDSRIKWRAMPVDFSPLPVVR